MFGNWLISQVLTCLTNYSFLTKAINYFECLVNDLFPYSIQSNQLKLQTLSVAFSP